MKLDFHSVLNGIHFKSADIGDVQRHADFCTAVRERLCSLRIWLLPLCCVVGEQSLLVSQVIDEGVPGGSLRTDR